MTEDAHVSNVRRELSLVGSRWDCAAWTCGVDVSACVNRCTPKLRCMSWKKKTKWFFVNL
jgi:hypothetical protein